MKNLIKKSENPYNSCQDILHPAKANVEKDIEFYQARYGTIIEVMVSEFDKNSHKKKFLNKINNEMWLIECEETGDKQQPYCIYYHESGNVSGYRTFNNNSSFIQCCSDFLYSVWGILVIETEKLKDILDNIMETEWAKIN